MTAGLQALGFEVLPSSANFVFTRHASRDAAALAAGLRERSIIVRHFRLPRIDQFLRITAVSYTHLDVYKRQPLLNYDQVLPALRLMLDDNAYGLSRRRVTVSTSGVVPMMDRLSQDCPVALAVSCLLYTSRCV